MPILLGNHDTRLSTTRSEVQYRLLVQHEINYSVAIWHKSSNTEQQQQQQLKNCSWFVQLLKYLNQPVDHAVKDVLWQPVNNWAGREFGLSCTDEVCNDKLSIFAWQYLAVKLRCAFGQKQSCQSVYQRAQWTQAWRILQMTRNDFKGDSEREKSLRGKKRHRFLSLFLDISHKVYHFLFLDFPIIKINKNPLHNRLMKPINRPRISRFLSVVCKQPIK